MTTTFSPVEVSAYLSTRNFDLDKAGAELRGPCPIHGGSRDSFSLKPDSGEWFCHSECQRGGGLIDLEMGLSGNEFKDVIAEVKKMVGRPDDVIRRVESTFDYRDSAGKLSYQVVRIEGRDLNGCRVPFLLKGRSGTGKLVDKLIFQRRPREGGGWDKSIKGLAPLPYHLQKLTGAAEVLIIEGETGVEAAEGLGFTATCNSGGAGKFNSKLAPFFIGKNVAILPDNDKPGREHANDVARKLFKSAASVKIIELPELEEKGDVVDWIAAGGTKEQLRDLIDSAPVLESPPVSEECTEIVPAPGSGVHWNAGVTWLAFPNGFKRPVLENAVTALRHAPEWDGTLAYDDFANRPVFKKDAPDADAKAGGPVEDHHVSGVTCWMQRKAGVFVGRNTTGEAVYFVARHTGNHFHPVQDYLRSLTWDGKPRLNTWLHDYMGVADAPETRAYVRAVGRCWMISGVARIMEPGVKADHMLILEGKQGALKSTAISSLLPDTAWFTDQMPPIGDKDCYLQLRGKWIIELAELSNFHGRAVEKIKSFLSSPTDTYRPPYGRTAEDVPRQVIFVGTTNDEEYLEDPTGGRRFWPVKTGKLDIDRIRVDRDQLWAEAVARYDSKEHWWLDAKTEALASKQQAERHQNDIWLSHIERWCEEPVEFVPPVVAGDGDGPGPMGLAPAPPFFSTREQVLASEILQHCIVKPVGQWSGGTNGDAKRIGKIMRSMGWERRKLPCDDDMWRWFWCRPAAEAEQFKEAA